VIRARLCNEVIGRDAMCAISEVTARLTEVRSMEHSGLALLKLSSSHFLTRRRPDRPDF
jgi:hypothetical protein